MIQPDDQNNQNNQHDQVITSYTPTDDDAKHQQTKPPSVLGEESISGDTPAESPDIDEELEKVGLDSDKNGPEPLPGRSILEEEEK